MMTDSLPPQSARHGAADATRLAAAPATRQVDIALLGKDYRVACPAGKEGRLMEAALLLDARMREIQAQGKLLGAEKIAIMAALNIAHDFLFGDESKSYDLLEARRRIRTMEQQLDQCFFAQDSLF